MDHIREWARRRIGRGGHGALRELARETGVSVDTIRRLVNGASVKVETLAALSKVYEEELARLQAENVTPFPGERTVGHGALAEIANLLVSLGGILRDDRYSLETRVDTVRANLAQIEQLLDELKSTRNSTHTGDSDGRQE